MPTPRSHTTGGLFGGPFGAPEILPASQLYGAPPITQQMQGTKSGDVGVAPGNRRDHQGGTHPPITSLARRMNYV